MSKQYLTTHTVENAHITDIFSIAVTPSQIISSSGASAIKIYSALSEDFPVVQTLESWHKLGCHHMASSRDGRKFASIGFGGEVKVCMNRSREGQDEDSKEQLWVLDQGPKLDDKDKHGQLWAIAMDGSGRFLAATTIDGRIKVWDLLGESAEPSSPATGGGELYVEYQTKGSFGMCLDISADGRFTASGHQNGGVYLFNNQSSRMTLSLPSLIKPVRAVSFSPGGKLLAAAGDSRIISLFDVISGDQVGNLTGHGAWIMSLDWNDTGEHLLSGAFDGKAKVWSIDTRECVATHSESNETLWTVKWLPKTGRTEMFVTAGADRSISIYREATGS